VRIGLALSGGGIRAAVFHLGVLQYLAERGKFRQIASISSVSGASLCIGAIFAVSGNKWPAEDDFLSKVQPLVRRLILEKDIQKTALRRLPFSPQFWRHRVLLLAKVLQEQWGINGSLQDLPTFPFWEINCTAFETGRSFRFRRDYMGSKEIGFVKKPTLPIADMIAASAAFPVLIGPYILEVGGRNYSLWDGGVYDNLGLDALHKIGRGMDSEINYIIVSNAGAPLEWRQRGRPSANMRRLLEIAMSQVDVLRTQDFISSVVGRGKGAYVKIGQAAGDYPTNLNAPSPKDFDLIFMDGYDTMLRVDQKRSTWVV